MDGYVTTGQIQEACGLPHWRVCYILRTRRLEAAGRIGPCRVYPSEIVETVKRIADSIDRGRESA